MPWDGRCCKRRECLSRGYEIWPEATWPRLNDVLGEEWDRLGGKIDQLENERGFVLYVRVSVHREQCMGLRIPGIIVTSKRDAGSRLIYEFVLVKGRESESVAELLRTMKFGQELWLSDPGRDEGLIEIRRVDFGFELKRGQHGCSGSWQSATSQEAHDALMAVAPFNNDSSLRPDNGYFHVPRWGAPMTGEQTWPVSVGRRGLRANARPDSSPHQ